MARKDSDNQKKSMSAMFRGRAMFLAVRSLEKLEQNIRAREGRIAVITGHTGWTDDLDFAFAHRAEICRPFTKRYSDPEAPYDGYEEAEDTEEGARTVPLAKKKGTGAAA